MTDWAKSDPRKDGGLLLRNTLIVRAKRAHPEWTATEVAEHVEATGKVRCPLHSVGQVWRGYEMAKLHMPDSELVKGLEGPGDVK